MSNPETCTICHNEINMEKSVYTNCEHRFCTSCFFTWMRRNPNCPNCRNKFISLNDDAQEELDNTMLAAQDWEDYIDQLKIDVQIIEERLNEVCGAVLDRERELADAKLQLQLVSKEREIQQIQIKKIELAWIEKQRQRANYIREWRELHSRRGNFTMRF